MSDYVLTATNFDQVTEYYPDGRRKSVVKHHRGDIVTGLTESEASRLLAAGAIATQVSPPPPTVTAGVADTLIPASAPSAEPKRPKATAPKSAWVDYAVATGVNRDEAQSMDRHELIELLS